MRFLSLWQPWASLMAIGAKRIETRSWATSYKGLVGIHATKAFPDEAREICLEDPFRRTLKAAGFVTLGDLPRGAVLAVVELVDCYLIQGGPIGDEGYFGNYTPGRFGWCVRNVRFLREPMPCRGHQGLWLDPEVEAKVKAALETAR